MPKHAIPLTDTQIKKSKPKDRNYKLSDGKGLYMIVSTNGGKWWRMDYTFGGKRKTLSLGTYPTVTLVDAREEALRLKRMIHQGIDPLEERKEEKQQIKEDTKLNEFEQKTQLHLVVDEWFKLHEKKVSGYTAGKTRALLDNKFIPYFAELTSKGYVKTSIPISKIKHYEITALLKEVSKETEYTAKKLKQFLDRIWIFAVTSGYCEQNIISNISNEILPSSKVEHISKITDERSLSQLLHSIENYTGGVMVKASLQFVTYTMLRASTLVNLKWEYVDFEAKTLTIPRAFLEIIKDEEEELNAPEFDVNALPPYIYHSLEQLKSWTTKGEVFHSEELTVKTTFGDYTISADLFTANSYNEYLQKLLDILTHKMGQLKIRGHNRSLPSMQIHQSWLVGLLDTYIRTRLFSQNFNPLENENWRVLMLKNANITPHITNSIHRLIYNMQNSTTAIPAIVNKRYFSQVSSLNMMVKYALDLQKTIYEKTAYPSNKGGFEKAFMEFLDTDSKVLKFIKILEFKHDFAIITYFRKDGLMASYYPDFMVETERNIYLVETKSDKDIDDVNVKQKQRAAIDYVKRINALDASLRENKLWAYLLISEKQFYEKSGADIEDLANSAKINEAGLTGNLFDL